MKGLRIMNKLRESQFGVIAGHFSLACFKKKWKKQNPNNYTYAKNKFPIESVSVGNATYGGLQILNDVPSQRLIIGSYCSIAEEVLFVLGREHKMDYLSTYPFKCMLLGEVQYEAFSKGDIIIEDDVWIGYRAMILSGIKIGQGAVVAAGAVVTRDVPPYAVVAGVPARIIKYRFPEEVIDKLLDIDFSKLSEKTVREVKENLYRTINIENVDEIIEKCKIKK